MHVPRGHDDNGHRRARHHSRVPDPIFERGDLTQKVAGPELRDRRGIADDLDRNHLGDGVGTRLLEALEARLAPGTSYLLLVVGANQRAVRFYESRGFVRELEVDGPSFFAEHMGIELPQAEYVPSYVMRRTLPV